MVEFVTVVAFFLAINGLDDLAIDIIFLVRTLHRRLLYATRYRRTYARDLIGGDQERPIVVMIPAWGEAAVLPAMLTHVLASQHYRNYRLFVGCYPNDHETQASIADIDDPRLHRIIMPHDGPTTKADCLNGLYAAARATGVDWHAYCLHDAEDVIHPYELHLVNRLIGRKDLLQLPVRPIARHPFNLVGGHYCDEFAENHLKTMVVREYLTGTFPSAGVGCAVSAARLDRFADAHNGRPFNPEGLTEDYEFALRFIGSDGTAAFVRLPVVDDAGTGHPVIETAEIFPHDFAAAVRQKSRWLVGIVYQGTRTLGWSDCWRRNYMLYRDRKAVFVLPVTLAAYCCLALFIGIETAALLDDGRSRVWPLLTGDPLLALLLAMNGVLFCNRLIQRVAAAAWIYGPAHILPAIIRIPVADAVNLAALMTALGQIITHRRDGKPLAWKKTSHSFPTPTQPADP